MAVSRASATSSSRTVARAREHLAERGVGDGGGARHAGQLARVFHLSQRFHHPARGHGLCRGQVLGPTTLGRPGHVVGLEAEPRDRIRLRRVGQRVALGLEAADAQIDRRRRDPTAVSCSAAWVR